MKKGIRIFLMIVVVVLVFAGVQWVPNIVNQMQEKKDLGQAVITKDSTSKKNIGMQLSYAEKMIFCRHRQISSICLKRKIKINFWNTMANFLKS